MQITPRTVTQAFLQNEARLLQLKESPQETDSLAQLSSDTLARALEPLPADWRASARQLSLQALSQGLLCGALDGAILYQAGQLEPLAENRAGDEGKLLRGLGQARQVADQSWRGMGADDLQLLSGYGKHQNQATEAEAEQAATRGSADEFRTFLLATFKAGYAVGLVDAAVVFVAGEAPGQPPA